MRSFFPAATHSQVKFVADSIDHPGSHNIEKEFGVPIPGEILDPAQWAKTALKKVPTASSDFGALFGRTAPIILDLGCGNGRFSISSALERPDCDHLAVDILSRRHTLCDPSRQPTGLANIRFAVIGGRELLADKITPRRSPRFTAITRSRLRATPGSPAADHSRILCRSRTVRCYRGGCCDPDRQSRLLEIHSRVAPVFFEFQEHPEPWPDAPRGRTRREIRGACGKACPCFADRAAPNRN